MRKLVLNLQLIEVSAQWKPVLFIVPPKKKERKTRITRTFFKYQESNRKSGVNQNFITGNVIFKVNVEHMPMTIRLLPTIQQTKQK